MLALLLAATLSTSAPATLTPEALRARYGNIQHLTADVLQRKEGRYWARPFESRIRLTYTPQRVTWETVSPVASKVVLEGGGMGITGPTGERRDLGPAGGDPRLGRLVRFIRALLAFDLPGIERDFILSYGVRELLATPRPDSDLNLFRYVRLRFDERLDIVSLEFDTDVEHTLLTFANVQSQPAPPR